MLSANDLRRIMPFAGKRADVFLVPLVEAMEEFGIDTPARQAMFLPQVAHESGELRYVEEIASGRAYTGREDLGNTKPEAIRIAALHGSLPGPWWKGHGLIQITGYDNHLACGKALGIDLLNHPGLLTVPVYAARSAGWFWQVNDINRYADAGDFDGVCDEINRGRKTVRVGDANGYKERSMYFERATRVLAQKVVA